MAQDAGGADFEQMISQLSSDEGKAQVVRNLVGKADIPVAHVEMAIQTYERNGNLADAVEIARLAGMTDRAMQMCL